MSTSTNEVKIEKGVPLPKRTRLPQLPLDEMVKDDSFFLEMSTDNASRAVQTLRQRISRYQAEHPNKRFSVTKDISGKGMRVHRIL